jgi:hypothetical protein
MGTNDRELWWGFSSEHGWVVLDHDDPRNDPEETTVYLRRCSDWEILEVNRTDWDAPEYYSSMSHLESFPTTIAREIAERELRALMEQVARKRVRWRHEYERVREAEKDRQREIKLARRRELSVERNNAYRLEKGLLRGTVVDPPYRSRRSTDCWRCKARISSPPDFRCKDCKGWIICHKCGACGCGFERFSHF